MARLLDANHAFVGGEPKFNYELTKIELIRTLNWYSQNKTDKDAYNYSVDYFKKKLKVNAEEALKTKPCNFGWLCRIVYNGGFLSVKDQILFDNEIEAIKNFVPVIKETKKVVDTSNVISIQDRIREKVSECIGELEGQIDELVVSNFTANVSPFGAMHTMGIKGIHANRVVDFFKEKRQEFDNVLTTDDKEIKEGYSNFTKPQLKKLVAYCDAVIIDGMKISGESVKNRKPRKRKVKSPEELVSKIKYCVEFAELKLKSVSPKDIIGAMQLWVYNTKTRKMGCYHADDAGGFSMKGTSLLNFNETKSIQKRLRKPEVTLPEVINGGKVYLRNVIENIRAVDSGLTGRLNDDTILLKIIK